MIVLLRMAGGAHVGALAAFVCMLGYVPLVEWLQLVKRIRGDGAIGWVLLMFIMLVVAMGWGGLGGWLCRPVLTAVIAALVALFCILVLLYWDRLGSIFDANHVPAPRASLFDELHNIEAWAEWGMFIVGWAVAGAVGGLVGLGIERWSARRSALSS